MMETVFIGLGSNLDTPHQQVLKAFSKLKALPKCEWICASSLYATPPWGIEDQPPFINAVVKMRTQLEPHTLLEALLAIEREQGRIRDIRFGPRIIDCDILLYANQQISSETLSVPHPYLTERAFVVVPLYEIAPTLLLPCDQPLAAVAEKFKNEKIEKFTLNSEDIIS